MEKENTVGTMKHLEEIVNYYNEKKFETSNLLDKYILSFSSGAIGISIAFLRQIRFQSDTWLQIMLLISLSIYFFLIIATLLSIHLNILVYGYKPNALFGKKEERTEFIKKIDNNRKFIKFLGFFSKVGFLIATFLLIFFVGFNINNIK